MRIFTPEMIKVLKQHGSSSRADIANLINSKFGSSVTARQVQAKCNDLGLKAGSNGQFGKGQTSWNKGIKNSTGFSSTRYKKGNVPATARPVGYERINADGHIEIKVEGERQMICKHRWVWEQAHGPVPEGYVVSFKNGIKTDCRIENLILLTRAELVRLNQSFIKLSTPETHETCVLLAKLKSKAHELKVA